MVRKDFDRVASELVLITTYCRSSGRTLFLCQSGLNSTLSKLLHFFNTISFLVM